MNTNDTDKWLWDFFLHFLKDAGYDYRDPDSVRVELWWYLFGKYCYWYTDITSAEAIGIPNTPELTAEWLRGFLECENEVNYVG